MATDTIPDAVVPPNIKADAQSAIESGDPKTISSLIPLASGTPVAPALQTAAANSAAVTAPIQSTLDAVNAKGGVDTPDGRLEAAKHVMTFADQQPETSFWKGLAQGLMGNPNWRLAATQGAVTSKTMIGSDGSTVTAWVPENSNRPLKVINNSTGQELTPQQFEAGKYGLYSNMESTPGYKQSAITAEAAANKYVSDIDAANRGVALTATIAQNSDNAHKWFAQLANSGLSSNDINELYSRSSQVTANKSSLSSGLQSLKQSNDTTSFNNAIDKMKANGVTTGIPKILGFTEDGKLSGSDGHSYSMNDLTNMVNTFNNSASTENQINLNKADIVGSKVYGKLNFQQKQLFDNALNAFESNEKLKTANADVLAKIPVLSQSIPYHVGQPLPVGMANAVVDQANAKAAALYQSKLYNASRNGAIPEPGSIAYATSIDPSLADIRAKTKASIDDIQQNSVEPASAAPTEVKAPTTGMPPPQQQPKTLGAPPPRSNPAATVITNSLPKGIPVGSVRDGVTPDGKPVWKSPDGKHHVPD